LVVRDVVMALDTEHEILKDRFDAAKKQAEAAQYEQTMEKQR
jgi:hypothetical protein